jgi:regulator of replication initiation timing
MKLDPKAQGTMARQASRIRQLEQQVADLKASAAHHKAEAIRARIEAEKLREPA